MWQLTRRPNHSIGFYPTTVAASMGVLVVISAAVGLVVLRHRSSWREVLLLSWISVPFVFFEVWPVKGFSYLLLLAPAVCVLAARPLAWLVDRVPTTKVSVATGLLACAVVITSLLVPSAGAALGTSYSGLAGAGGTPGGREAGRWVAEHVPQGARLMTLGPSMGNVLAYYSGRHADGLSVSPSPMHRNPSYLPIPNPDSALRSADYQYVVWDAYSAQRSPHFADKELALVRKYHGVAVHTERATLAGRVRPVIVIYEVHP